MLPNHWNFYHDIGATFHPFYKNKCGKTATTEIRVFWVKLAIANV